MKMENEKATVKWKIDFFNAGKWKRLVFTARKW